MHSGNNDDFLQFKDYSSTPSTGSPAPAEISVNSPTNATIGGTGSGRTRGDPLSELIYDMSRSAEVNSSNEGRININQSNSSAEGSPTTTNKLSFLSIEYYQQFFNVDTMMVVERVINSMLPKRAPINYLRNIIGENPDLYGPFWINITLIFTIAISGNISSYLQNANDNYHWHYNFHLVSYAATCIFLYVNFIPAALWALFKYSLKPVQEGLETESADYTPSLLSLLCIYGYSLAIYIPVCILWVIQYSLFQWLLVVTAAFLSGSVLIYVLTPALRNSKISLFLMIGIMGAHSLLAVGFMLYFFHVPNTAITAPPTEHAKLMETVTKAAQTLIKEGIASNTQLKNGTH